MRSKLNILLIEDSKEDTIIFKRIVSKLNETSQSLHISVQNVVNLQEALTTLKQDPFDLILLDLSLSDASGVEGIEVIHHNYGNEYPVIVLTGEKDEEMAVKAIQSGAQDYLRKGEISAFNLSKSIMYALDRKKTTKELEILRIRQAQSLKMATLGEMAGGIAHEINNPLSIILGYVDRIKRKCAGGKENIDLDEFLLHLDKIESTTNRITKTVKSLKAYSRREDNDPMEPVKLINIVEDTLSLCTEKFKTASIELVIGEIMDVELLCQDIQLSQVLLNLLNNAHDAIQNSNQKWVKLFSQLEGDSLHLYIVDSGKIIDEKTKNKIFTPFFTTKAKGEGTGLGMSISKNIIESHKGKIELIDSERNTTFRITLPILIKDKRSS